MPISEKKNRRMTLAKLARRGKKANDKKSGRKKPRKQDIDQVEAAPDSLYMRETAIPAISGSTPQNTLPQNQSASKSVSSTSTFSEIKSEFNPNNGDALASKGNQSNPLNQDNKFSDKNKYMLSENKSVEVPASTPNVIFKTPTTQNIKKSCITSLSTPLKLDQTTIPEIIISPTLQPLSKLWLEDLKLTVEDQQILKSPTGWVNDGIMFACMVLARKQYTAIKGLYDTLRIPYRAKEWKYDKPFPFTQSPAVQIHHDGYSHWVTSVKFHENIYLLDSLDMGVNGCVDIQLGAMYGSPGKEMEVIIPNIQKQKDTNACGIFAIANMVEFCSNLYCGLKPLVFDDRPMRMRNHLHECLVNRMFKPFPSKVTKEERTTRIHLNSYDGQASSLKYFQS